MAAQVRSQINTEVGLLHAKPTVMENGSLHQRADGSSIKSKQNEGFIRNVKHRKDRIMRVGSLPQRYGTTQP